MKISIFGLGYVGCVNLACLAHCGHEVIGVDTNLEKVDLVSQGKPTIVEKELDALFEQNKTNIKATNCSDLGVSSSEISLICVGTPPSPSGDLDLSHLWAVAEQIGSSLKKKDSFHVLVIRSTIYPGTCARFAHLVAQSSGRTLGVHFEVLYNPEFLREGSAIADYFNPGLTVYGVMQEQSKGLALLKELTPQGSIEKIVQVKTAEMIKFLNNSWHALKVAFANECGSICASLGIDSQEAMQLFCQDHKLNTSAAYLKPGFAYGGYCLPKDLQGLVSMGEKAGLTLPLLSSVETSNRDYIRNVGDWIVSFGKKRILLLGIAFKEGTDDVRFSPKIDLARHLIEAGCTIGIYDPYVTPCRLSELTYTFTDNPLQFDPEIAVIANQSPEYLSIANALSCPILELNCTSMSSSQGYSWKNPSYHLANT